jgi:hypothetical protein
MVDKRYRDGVPSGGEGNEELDVGLESTGYIVFKVAL